MKSCEVAGNSMSDYGYDKDRQIFAMSGPGDGISAPATVTCVSTSGQSYEYTVRSSQYHQKSYPHGTYS